MDHQMMQILLFSQVETASRRRVKKRGRPRSFAIAPLPSVSLASGRHIGSQTIGEAVEELPFIPAKQRHYCQIFLVILPACKLWKHEVQIEHADCAHLSKGFTDWMPAPVPLPKTMTPLLWGMLTWVRPSYLQY